MEKLDRFFSLIAIVAGLMVIVTSIAGKNEDNHLKKTGAKATATVVDTVVTTYKLQSRSNNSFKDKSVWGIYQFKAADGNVYRVQATTAGTHLGKQTTIYYDPTNPAQVFYLDSDAYGFYLGVAIGLVIMILGAVFYRRAKAGV